MSGQTVDVLVTSPLMAMGKAWAKGSIIKAEPLQASQLVASGRATLRNIGDAAAVDEAENRHTARVCHMDSSRGRFFGAR
jgi:hypothetical protein